MTLSFSAGGQIIAAHAEMISPREFSEAKSAFSECVCVSLKSVYILQCGAHVAFFHSVRSIYLPRGGDRRKADAGFLPAFTCILSPVTLKFNTYGERVCASGILLRANRTRGIYFYTVSYFIYERVKAENKSRNADVVQFE